MQAAVVALAAAALWAPGFGLNAQGVPIIRIGLAAGLDQAEITQGGQTCIARSMGRPAKLRSVVAVERARPDEASVQAALAAWRIRGHAQARPVERGAVYSFGDGVVDTRVVWIGVADPGEGARGPSLQVVETPPTGLVSMSCAAEPAEAFRLARASFRGVAYPGTLVVALDGAGKLAVMNEVDAETALASVVPAETFPSAPAAALQAQAVAARNQLLVRLGNRHMGDPFHLCDETHCQVYSPTRRAPSTSAAVAATRGEVVSRKGGLVDTVYSANCGGFPAAPGEVFTDAPGHAGQGAPDLSAPRRPWCGQTRFGKDKYRWNRSIPEVRVLERGASGRVVAAELADGRVVRGQLRIRRALGGLPSALFSIRDGHAHGGGYGHGAGMCQVGAIGQAEAGRGHDAILRSYYGDDTRIRRLW